ncbi:MAG: mercury methylation ferredoxin HgcB [Deltaproteobacteria bacterium]
MNGFAYLPNVTTLTYDRERCTGCGMCAEVCPHQVFALEDRKARVVRRDACMECGACARNCPAFAIDVDAGVGCATGLIQEWIQGLSASGRSAPGCC